MRPNNFAIILCMLMLCSCAATKATAIGKLYTGKVKKGEKVAILPKRIKGRNCNPLKLNEYAINDAIEKVAKSSNEYRIVGLSEVVILQRIDSFMFSLDRCIEVIGYPMVVYNKK